MIGLTERLHRRIVAIAPVIGISIGDASDKSTWRIDFLESATRAQREAAFGIISIYDISAQRAVIEESNRQRLALDDEVRSGAKLSDLTNLSPEQVDSAIEGLFGGFTKRQMDIFSHLLKAALLNLDR